MQTTIVKWGNSRGVRIPKTFLQSIHLAENDPVEVTLEKERIVLKKSKAKKHRTTEERLKEFYGAEYDQSRIPQTEIDWGGPAGKEVW
jgi:antitoxin MazE